MYEMSRAEQALEPARRASERGGVWLWVGLTRRAVEHRARRPWRSRRRRGAGVKKPPSSGDWVTIAHPSSPRVAAISRPPAAAFTRMAIPIGPTLPLFGASNLRTDTCL